VDKLDELLAEQDAPAEEVEIGPEVTEEPKVLGKIKKWSWQ